ncbi:hypothetical protein BD626DRAFT_477857 [Schizophyllum amplum]|uniref:Uncharacterized protein n=1 Tax=Schizophyllum amplum TaxID=97359 RepID=A0A550D0K3_9AGAR|nr:hypothetical protein BD626DRAFT_477857 [Auriculariopsis ampla]
MRHAQGLADNGAGDTHCEAQSQGATHLERGQGFDSFDYLPDVSHQDYPMMAAVISQYRMFIESNGDDDSDTGVDPGAAGDGGPKANDGHSDNGATGLVPLEWVALLARFFHWDPTAHVMP